MTACRKIQEADRYILERKIITNQLAPGTMLEGAAAVRDGNSCRPHPRGERQQLSADGLVTSIPTVGKLRGLRSATNMYPALRRPGIFWRTKGEVAINITDSQIRGPKTAADNMKPDDIRTKEY